MIFTDANLQPEIMTGNLVVVEFSALWCGPCRMMEPILDRVSKKYPDARIGKIDVDDNPIMSMGYGIRSIPTIFIFKDGELKHRVSGIMSEVSLSNKIDELLQ